MQRILVVIALATLMQGMAVAQGTAAGQDKGAVLGAVHQFVDAFNKGDTKTAVAVCAGETSIIDDIPPHEWHGAGACEKWANDYDADATKNGITDGAVTLAAPRHVDVTGDRAYVVVPATYVFKQKGKPVKQSGSLLTVALQKSSAGWRISGWSWAKN